MNWKFFKQQQQPNQVDDLFHILNMPNALNILYWKQIFEMVENIEGTHICEFGVGRGRSLISLITNNLFRNFEKNKEPYEIWAFDSFKGFPEPNEKDKSFRNPKKGEGSKSPSGYQGS